MKKEKLEESGGLSNSKWWFIGLVLILVVIIIGIDRNNIISVNKIFMLIKPTVTSTPSPTVSDILPPFTNKLPRQTYIEMAISDLAEKSKVEKSKIEVIEVNEKKWNDTSLGCPEKDKLYAQVVTSGFVIKLKLQNRFYLYNAGLDKVVSCKSD